MPDSSVRGELDVLRKAGISWAMIAGFQVEEPLAFDIFKGAEACGKLIAESGFRVSSHHCLMSTFAPLDGTQKTVREKMRKNLDFCSLLKTETLVIHPGRIDGKHETAATIFSGFESELEKHGIERLLDTVAGNFRDMGEYAAKFGIRLALENLGRFEPLADMEFLLNLVRRIDLPNVGYCLDSGHAHVFGESVLKWVEMMGDKLFATHFHDNRAKLAGVKLNSMFIGANKGNDEHVSPGFGTISWMDVIAALKKVNYRHPVNFETGGWPVADKVESYRLAVAWWRACESMAGKDMKSHSGK
jgi:sugar phosphate isomerase/epimerase